jgi:deoxyribonuclease (pyrimidine dimer)
MTRINVIDPTELYSLHVLAEYRELPRVFTLAAQAHEKGLAWQKRQPDVYTLGPGHVLFFYDKLKWLSDRHALLVRDLIGRGYKPAFTESLYAKWRKQIPQSYWGNYKPTEDAIEENWERIRERMNGKRWWKSEVPFLI